MSSANESYGLEGCGRVIPFHWPMGSVSFSHDFYRPLQRAAQTSNKQNYFKIKLAEVGKIIYLIIIQ